MPFKDHFDTSSRFPCQIVTVDPVTKVINAVTKAGPIQISTYTGPPLSRWPRSGENWVVKRENGSWYLDTILADPNDTLSRNELKPGDVHIDAPNNGLVYLSTGTTLARKFTQVVGNACKTKWVVVHDLNDIALHISVVETKSPFAGITAFTWKALNPNEIEVTFSVAPAKEGAQIVMIG